MSIHASRWLRAAMPCAFARLDMFHSPGGQGTFAAHLPATFMRTHLLAAAAVLATLFLSGTSALAVDVVADPTFSPASGTSGNSPITVTISSATPGATIYYTVDGSTPTTTSPMYITPLPFATSVTVRAYAVVSGMTESAFVSATYTISSGTVASPVFSPASGTSGAAPFHVTLSSTTSDATITYTTDGSTPTTSSPVYTGTLALSTTGSTTVKALGAKSGMANSTVSSATYTVTPSTVATPTITPSSGTSGAAPLYVYVYSSTSEATIYYTTNGTTPTTTSSVYTGSISLSSYGSTTVRAIAAKSGMTNSAIASATYNVTSGSGLVVTPTFTPTSGTSGAAPLYVYLYSPTLGGTIYYSTDGSTPTTSSYVYTGSIPLYASTTIRAMTYANGISSSATSAWYTITSGSDVVATPTFSPVSGTSGTAPLSISLSDATSGATIYFTTDGSTPTTSSYVYSSPITLTALGTTTIRAFATANGSTSETTSASYTVQSANTNVFNDVPTWSEFSSAIGELARIGAVSGQGGFFRPNDSLTRAELCKIVVLAAGRYVQTPTSPTFTDVDAGDTLFSYVETAAAAGIVNGYSDGTFRPDAAVTRGEAAKIVVGAFGLAITTTGGPRFSDVPSSHGFSAYVETLFNAGVVRGSSSSFFGVDRTITRAEMAKIVVLARAV